MKKLLIFMCALCIWILSFGLSACGSTEAKIVDIWASVVLPDEENIHSETLTDKNTLAENDYILEVGKTYNLTVTYIAAGGSKYPGFTSTDGINLIYDSEALKITACEQ